MVEVAEAGAFRFWIALAQPVELRFVGRALPPVTIDKINQASANALDRGRIESLAAPGRIGRLRAEIQAALKSIARVHDAKGHRRSTRTVLLRKIRAMRAGLFIDEVADVALAIEGDRLPLVPRDGSKAHQAEQVVQVLRLGMRIFDEFEAVSSGRIMVGNLSRRRIMRKGSHGELLSVATEHNA